jgi:peptidoglycan/xylan/chitin deacetylase (PgdA/CDA1 family)
LTRAIPLAIAALLWACGPAPASAATPVPILLYHGVQAKPFARQMAALARAGYHPVTLRRAWREWHFGGALPRRPIVLSFDDGYPSQYRTAAAVLRARRWPGVLNLMVNRLDAPGGITSPQVRRLIADRWEIDAHSVSHPDLTTLDADRLRAEVGGSRDEIQRRFGVPADFFCYPYGRYDATVEAAVRDAGFLAATTIEHGLASASDDPFALDRIAVGIHTTPHMMLRRIRTAAR